MRGAGASAGGGGRGGGGEQRCCAASAGAHCGFRKRPPVPHTATLRTARSLGLTRVAGELVATPFPVPKPTQAVRPGSAFDGTTTNAYFIRQVG